MGLLSPIRPPIKGITCINAFSGTEGQQKRLHVKPPKPFVLTIKKVRKIVPRQTIPEFADVGFSVCR